MSSSPFLRSLGLLACALGLTACAQSPRLPPQGLASYATAHTFQAAERAWPRDRWWEAYGDPQLNALIEEGLHHAPDIRMAAARLQQAEAIEQMTGASRLPQMGANASVSKQKQSQHYLTPANMTPLGWKDYGRVTLDFSWEIDFWGKNRAALAAATSERAAREAEMAQAKLGLATAIATYYAELLQAIQLQEVSVQATEVKKKAFHLISQRFEHGLETQAAVDLAQLAVATFALEKQQLDENVALKRHALAALMGAGPDRALTLQPTPRTVQPVIGLPKDLSLNLLGRRPDIVAARLQAEAASKRIDEAQAAFYPNLNLSAFIGVQSLGLAWLNQGASQIGSVGPALSLPIFTGGRLTGQLNHAQAQFDVAVASYEKTLVHALQEVADAAMSQKSGAAQWASAEQAHRAATHAHALAQQRYEKGIASYLTVLSAEEARLMAWRSVVQLKARSLALEVALIRALGGGYHAVYPEK